MSIQKKRKLVSAKFKSKSISNRKCSIFELKLIIFNLNFVLNDNKIIKYNLNNTLNSRFIV